MASIITFAREWGYFAPVLFFLLFVVQAVFPVFPYIILAATGGLLFGFTIGFFISWAGALAGACIGFYLCRFLGYGWFSRQPWGTQLQQIHPDTAFWSVLIARIVPVVPTPIINASAALGGMPFWSFFFSSALGKLPSAILYTGLGLTLYKAQDVTMTLAIIGTALLLFVGGKYFYKQHQDKKAFSTP